MSELPLDARGRRHAFFAEDGVDQLVSITLELATELWVVRERLYALEAVSAPAGLREKVEAFQPDEAQRAELAAMRTRMLNEIFRSLGREHRPARERPADA